MATPQHRRKSGTITTPEQAFGQVLRAVRKSRSLSQDELADKAGYHRTYIGILERGEKSPSLRTLFNLCGVLAVSPAVLVRKAERLLGSNFAHPRSSAD